MMPIRHVLMTADTVGGVWTYSIQLAHGLSALGIRVSLATMGAPLSPAQREDSRGVWGLEVHESAYRLEWMNEPWKDVEEAGVWLLNLEQRLKPDLVHLNGFVHGSLPWRSPVVVVAHSCVLSWWHAVRGEAAPAEWLPYAERVRRGLLNAHAAVGVSGFLAGEMERWYGPLPPVRTIYNSIGQVGSGGAGSGAAGSKQALVLSCGRLWDEAKNAATLNVAAKGVRWPVYVAGDGTHPDGGDVNFKWLRGLGKLSPRTLGECYAAASIYALPARYEPFGLSVLEAAEAGCALVLGDIPSLRELWQDAAIFVPPGDAEALSLVLNLLIVRTELRLGLGERAKARAASFTTERMVGSYLEVYEDARKTFEGAKAESTCAS